MVCRHFAACCFSIRVTRSFDAVRLVIVACLATVADAVMRLQTCDVPSLLCLSYSGDAAGPGGRFGFEIGSFAVESEDLQLSNAPYVLVGIVGISCVCCWLALAVMLYSAVRRRLGRWYGSVMAMD